VDPGAAVQERQPAHPVGMVVQDHQVEGLGDPPEQGQRDVMKIARAQQRQGRLVVLGGSQAGGQRFLKTAKPPEGTRQAQAWAPSIRANSRGPPQPSYSRTESSGGA